jgi:hypothetical protein
MTFEAGECSVILKILFTQHYFLKIGQKINLDEFLNILGHVNWAVFVQFHMLTVLAEMNSRLTFVYLRD